MGNKFLHPIFAASLVGRTDVVLLAVPAHLIHPRDKTWHGRKINLAAPSVTIVLQA